MPSHAPLSTRDGRIRSSSVQQVGDSLYYSNDDIELLHQVVILGQEILPTLPKRDRLPTTALFRAADVVFPRYGLDPDGEHKLSSIIFKVGGMRSTDNLLDRFRTVLSRMGIELEYIEESSVDGDNNDGFEPPSPARIKRRRRSSSRRSSSQHRRNLLHLQQQHQYQHPPAPHPPPSPSTHSATPSSLHERLVQAAVHSEAQNAKGRRRRNSDTAAELVVSADMDQHNRGRDVNQVHQGPYQKNRSISRQHQRRRSDSQAPSSLNYKEHFGQISEPKEPLPVQKQSSRTSRPIAPWLSQIPQYTDDVEKTEDDLKQTDLPEDDDFLDDADEADEEERVEDDDGDYAGDGDDEDYDDENENDKAASVDEYTRSLQMLLPIRERQQHNKHHNHYSNSNPDDIQHTQHAQHAQHAQDAQDAQDAHYLLHTHNYQHHQELPLRTRPLPTSLPDPHNAPVRPINSSMQAAGSWTEPQSPRSARSVVSDDEEVFIPSDTTIQEELEKGPAPKVDPLIMAKVADTYFMRFTFLGGMAVEAWRTISAAHQEQERYAAQIDRELSLSEAMLVWNDVAKAHIDDMSGKMKEVQELRDERPVTIYKDHVEDQPPQATADPMADNGTGIVAAAAEIASNAEEVQAEAEAEAEIDGNIEGDKENVPADDISDLGVVVDEDEDEAAEEYRLRQEQRDRLMNRAARVYTITTLFNAVNHWHTMACEEVSRTKTARRHILRKKVFFAWRDQTASDYAKATTLTRGWFVQRWVSALRQVQHEGDHLAVQFYNRDLVTVKFWTWFRTHQEQTATAWANNRIRRDAVNSWLDAYAVETSIGEDADLLARHVRLSTAGNQWIDQTQTQQSILHRIEEQENETYMRAAVQDWAKECFCLAQLRAVQSRNDKRDKEGAFNVWRQSAADSQHRTAQLDLDIAEEYVAHWQRETRLAMFKADYEFDLKVDAVHSWILVEKLAFLMRYRDEQLLRKTCLYLKANFGTLDEMGQEGHGEQQREDELARTADNFYKLGIVSDLVSAFHAQTQDNSLLQEIAEQIDEETLVNTYICEDWSAAAAASVRNEELACRGAFYVGVVNSLDGWSAHACAVRKERLRTTYRDFRRQAKRQTATECVAAWTSALGDVGDEATANDGTGRGGGYDVADELRYEHETHTIFATLNNWILETNDRLFQQSVAAEADTEVYLSRWRLQLAGCEELGAAAAEHDTVTQMAGRWDDWELQAVQARAREHTATALHEKNDRRLGRRVLAIWQQQLAEPEPEPELDDLQASSYGPMSMSVGRWPAEGGGGNGLRTTASQWRLDSLISSPLVARSDPPRGGARSANSLLHPIVESPIAPAPVKRPLFSRGVTDGGIAGSYSVPVPGGSAPAMPALYGPSPGAGPLRRLHRSTVTAPAYNRQYQKEPEPEPEPEQSQQQQQPTVPSSSIATSATLTPGRDSHRHLLLQRRLQSAARLADSIQLGPMSEFDDYDHDYDEGYDNDDMETTQLHDADRNGDTHGQGDPGADNYADVSSEGDEDLVGVDSNANYQRGRQGSAVPPARRQLLSLGQSTKTPTRFLQSDELPPLSSMRRQQVQSQSMQPRQPMFARPAGAMSASVSNNHLAPAPARRQTGFSLRKAAAATAAAAAGAPPLAFDPVTTTPMGPLPSPFERRLRAAYGSQGRQSDDFDEEDGDMDVGFDTRFEAEKPHVRRLAAVTATPLRPLRMSTLSMPQSAALGQSTTGRPGARVTFADSGR